MALLTFPNFVGVEIDGGHICMWNGNGHAEAVRQTNRHAVDFGGKVHDRTGGAS